MKATSGDDSVQSTKEQLVLKAIAYIREVDGRFDGQSDTLAKFRMLLRGYRDKQIEVADLAGRIIELFDGHPDLIFKFNYFMLANTTIMTIARGLLKNILLEI
ncbi:hypothetical protein Patl1_26010 [Pistacia atlantica]|uniref:Uncharacterized protein n=1 Tax=Pistacia atlantica TaxID=434234 RepID=A0ACC1B1I9_9ROSI|nr:hypothetical protein Patl1_26010 [Pistacia atlantica]